MKIPLYQVDAFTDRLFTGNPAAVVFLESDLTLEIMQTIAAENNLAETAFVSTVGDDYQIRWFTPTIEVDLCGHATLAAAHVIFHHLGSSTDEVRFKSKSGPLTVRLDGDHLFMNFPADKPLKAEPSTEINRELGADPVELYRGRDDLFAVFESEEAVASLSPDITALSRVPSRGVCATAVSHEVDFVSRFFAPQSGIPEDPVTGSSHTALIPFWAERLGKQKLHARQISNRGGDLICRDLGERVEIGGRAVTYLVGEVQL